MKRHAALAKLGSRVAALAVAVELVNGEPPAEVRLFRRGANDTEKGRFVFDDRAAQAVMAAFRRQGVDRMIDLEHLSLEDPERSQNFDPDARGWFQLELREGELWAVGIRWTEDGAERLRQRKQRYFSPAFRHDDKGRVLRLINVALTAMPATHGAEELVAASAAHRARARDTTTLGESMLDKKKALAAVKDADGDAALALLEAILANESDADDSPPPETPPAEGLADGEGDSEEPEEDEDGAAMMAASASLMRLTSKTTLSSAVREVETWRQSHIELEGERAKLAKDRAAIESGERRQLVAELVRLRAEIPATAWADRTAKKPCKRLQDEQLGDLRDRVAKLKAAGGAGAAPIRPPSTGDEDDLGDDTAVKTVRVYGKDVRLSALEVRQCGDDPETIERYAALKARQGRVAPMALTTRN